VRPGRCKGGVLTIRLAFVAAVAALAVLVPAAEAKEVMALHVCVPDGCHQVRDPEARSHAVVEGVPVAAPTRAAPFVRLRMSVGDGTQVVETFTTTFVPSAGLMQGLDGTWLRLDAAVVAALRDVARRLDPFPASRLRRPDPPPEPAPAAPPASAVGATDDGGGLPLWLPAIGVALLLAGAAAAVPVVRARRTAG
jgi:hypothetical protein